MIKCHNCQAQNKAEEVYCYNCGTLLQPVDYRRGDTTTTLKDGDTSTVDPKRRWGTARFDPDTILMLAIRDHPGEPIRVRMNGQHNKIIGRSHNDYHPDIDLGPFEGYERGVSRQHATLRRQQDTIVIIDNNSANNTYLNGQRLVPDQPRILRDGDEIRLGQLVLRVSFEDAYTPPTLSR